MTFELSINQAQTQSLQALSLDSQTNKILKIELDDRVDCIQMEELNNIKIDLMNF